MPPIFKALATMIVWILFITGCLLILVDFMPFVRYTGDWQFLALGLASLVISAVVMKIRKISVIL